MKQRVVVGLLLIIFIGGGAAVVKNRKDKIAHLPKPRVSPMSVDVAPVNRGTVEVYAHYLGSIEPFTRSDISARIVGAILSITKREGDPVKQGELLVTLDDRELVDRVAAVNADVAATRQKLVGARSAYETQSAVYDRDQTLYKVGAISQEALERSQANLDGARSTMEAYEENLKGLAMNASIAGTQAGYARIVAASDGVVSRRWAEPGDLATPGKPILTLERTTSFKVLAQVPQEEVSGIRAGAKVLLTSDGQTLQAAVNRVYPALGKNMLATVEVLMPSAPFGLPSGSTVGFDLVTKKVDGWLVPDQAVVENERGTSVYRITNGVVKLQAVTLLGMAGGKAAVDGNISPGDTVAVAQENKLLTLTDGTKVNPVVKRIGNLTGGGVQ